MPAPSSPTLAELQGWMRWALTHPLGVARSVAGEKLPGLPARFDEPVPRSFEVVTTEAENGRTSVDRLGVYASGYFSRLHGTLQLEYPRLEKALGERSFRELAAAHLLRRPSTSPSLADLGEGLAETLGSFAPAVEAPWLVELAHLERALAEIWLCDAGPFPPLSLPEGVSWEEARIELSPALRLLRLAWDVTGWTAGEGPPARGERWLVVWRQDRSVELELVESAPGAVLEALARGLPLGEACARAEALGLGAQAVSAAFSSWTSRGWISGTRG